MDIEDFANEIISKEDFLKFLGMIVEDYRQNKDKWENNDLESFLKGIEGYVYDCNEYSNYHKIELKPTLKLFAEFLLAARVYE